MNMIVEATICNIHDVLIIPGEEVVFDIPRYSELPVGVLDKNGALLGYLGRNEVTCVPGSVTGQDICQLLKGDWDMITVKAKTTMYYKTDHLKGIVEIQLQKKKKLALV